MKKYIYLFFGMLFPSYMAYSQFSTDNFSLRSGKCISQSFSNYSIPIEKDTLFELNIDTPISGFYVSGEALLGKNENSYIRVILSDNYNWDYLVYELYPILAESPENRFSRIAIETVLLDDIKPKRIKVEINDASLLIDSIHYIPSSLKQHNPFLAKSSSISNEQCQDIVDILNVNLRGMGKTWRAGVTSFSKMSFQEKENMFGGKVPNLCGFEYYVEGIFVVPESENENKSNMSNRNDAINQYVDEWDWRNRHGKNWMTSAKIQSDCASCWAFSSIGALESYVRLFYNKLINCDLSEQELVSCEPSGDCDNGGYIDSSYIYIRNNGVVCESCFQYTASNNICDNKCTNPTERITINNLTYTNNTSEESIIQQLFQRPLCFGIRSMWHYMVLTGYKRMQVGDVISFSDNTTRVLNEHDRIIIERPIWLLKDSQGPDWGDNGFVYISVNSSDIYDAYSINGTVNSLIYTNDSIVCEDADGDGYYNWGIGPRPTSCPSWAPLEKDGDDSDYSKGPLTQYGFLRDINPNENDTIFINNNTVYSTQNYLHQHIVIQNNASLTISNRIDCYNGVSIIISSGSSLIINGGFIDNVTLKPQSGSHIELNNGAQIRCNDLTPFHLPVGATLNQQWGMIE